MCARVAWAHEPGAWVSAWGARVARVAVARVANVAPSPPFGRSLWIPNGLFYALATFCIMMAISSISSLDETVTVQAEHLRLVFQRVLEMETTFWEQSESITNHIKHLEILVQRLENPTRRAFDETLERTVERGQQVATSSLSQLF